MEFRPGGCRARIPRVIAALFVAASLLPAVCAADNGGQEDPEYLAIKQRLARGWNTWNTRSVLSHTLLPEGCGLNLAFKQVRWIDEPYLREALFGRDTDDAHIRPGPHTLDGSYTRLDIQWQQLWARVESAHAGDDLVVLVTPVTAQTLPVKMVVESAIYWNRPGSLAKVSDNQLRMTLPDRTVDVYATASHQEDFYVQTQTPYLVLTLEQPVGLSTGRPRTVDQIRELIEDAREAVEETAATHGDLAEAYTAVEAGIAWNLVYDPRFDRVVSTVGRLWNEEYGGYCLFGWDNFFLAYMASLFSRDLAYANVLEHLRGATDEGFIPNDDRGNGSKSFDRSQPPVGAIMVREVYKKYPERWLLEATFDDLLAWNRWWMKRRLNGGLLSYGSHEAENPFLEPATQTKRTARYESGMDDSPMYEGVPFNKQTSTLELQDVGLARQHHAHHPLRALHHRARIRPLLTAQAGKLLEARLEDAGHADGVPRIRADLAVQRGQVAAGPEAVLEVVGRILRLPQGAAAPEDHGPGHHGHNQQQQHHQLHHQAGPGDQVEKRHVSGHPLSPSIYLRVWVAAGSWPLRGRRS